MVRFRFSGSSSPSWPWLRNTVTSGALVTLFACSVGLDVSAPQQGAQTADGGPSGGTAVPWNSIGAGYVAPGQTGCNWPNPDDLSGQCVAYARRRFEDAARAIAGWTGDAHNTLELADAAGWRTTNDLNEVVPGSIIVWSGGDWGHVATVERVVTVQPPVVELTEMNWGTSCNADLNRHITTRTGIVDNATLNGAQLAVRGRTGALRLTGYVLPVRKTSTGAPPSSQPIGSFDPITLPAIVGQGARASLAMRFSPGSAVNAPVAFSANATIGRSDVVVDVSPRSGIVHPFAPITLNLSAAVSTAALVGPAMVSVRIDFGSAGSVLKEVPLSLRAVTELASSPRVLELRVGDQASVGVADQTGRTVDPALLSFSVANSTIATLDALNAVTARVAGSTELQVGYRADPALLLSVPLTVSSSALPASVPVIHSIAPVPLLATARPELATLTGAGFGTGIVAAELTDVRDGTGGLAAAIISQSSTSVVMTLALPARSALWAIRVRNAAGVWSNSLQVAAILPDLTPPATIAPGDLASPGSLLPTSTASFEWSSVIGATHYAVSVWDESSGLSATDADVAGTTFVATLAPGRSYRWQVASCNGSACSVASGARFFRTPPSTQLIPATPDDLVPGSPTAAGPLLQSGSVTLSWSASSGATSYNFSVRDLSTNSLAVDAPGFSGTAYQVNLAAGRPFRWNIQACNNAGCSAYTAPLYFRTPTEAAPTLLPAPSLSTPSNGATGVATTPTFSWSSVSGANRYWLMVATSPGLLPTDPAATTCASCVITQSVSGTSSVPSSGTLSVGVTYYWKVQAFVLTGSTVTQQGNYSGVSTFTTQAAAPTLLPAPSLSTPSNGATGVPTTPTFSWSSVSGANRYWLMVATSPGLLPTDPAATTCASCVITQSVSGTSSVPSSGTLSAGVTYYWKVQAFVLTGSTVTQQGNYSAVSTFTTQAPAPTLLPAPSLSMPSNGASDVSTGPSFAWSSVSGANRYWLMVATSPGLLPTDPAATTCSSCVITQSVSGTSFTASSGMLSAGATYYWKVQAFVLTGSTVTQQGNYSGVSTFTTQAAVTIPAAPPTLISPGSSSSPGPLLSTSAPTFFWNAVGGATGYGLYISDVTSGTPVLVYDNDNVSNVTSLTLPSGYLFPGRTYRWNMRARNSAGFSATFSGHFYFRR